MRALNRVLTPLAVVALLYGDMKISHAGMGVSDAHFNALVEDLIKTLDKFKVPQREKDELLGILGPMKGDIVSASKY